MNRVLETVDEFIEFFEGIPDKKWTVGTRHNEFGQSCAYGHCEKAGPLVSKNLRFLFTDNAESVISTNDDVAQEWHYGETPKERILNVLQRIKKKDG